MHIHGKRSALFLGIAAAALSACGGGEIYVARDGRTMTFMPDGHVRAAIGGYTEREWVYRAERDSQGNIMELEMRHPDVGTRRFRARRGCLVGERDEGRFCPR